MTVTPDPIQPPCTEHPEDPLRHIHDANGRYIPACSWHPGEYHWICSDAAR